MRIVPAPALGSGDSGQLSALMGAVNELAAENQRLKQQAGKVQVKQVVVDRVIDNPALLEKLDQQRKQIEALEKMRLQSMKEVRTPKPQGASPLPVIQTVEKIIVKAPSWIIPAVVGACCLGLAAGYFAHKLM